MTTASPMGSQRWRRLIPLAFITYGFAYLDRSNYSLRAAGGLKHALHISSGQAGLLGGLFFIGYFLFQVPTADFAERRSVIPIRCCSPTGSRSALLRVHPGVHVPERVNVSGATMGVINAFGALGGFVGAYVVGALGGGAKAGGGVRVHGRFAARGRAADVPDQAAPAAQ